MYPCGWVCQVAKSPFLGRTVMFCSVIFLFHIKKCPVCRERWLRAWVLEPGSLGSTADSDTHSLHEPGKLLNFSVLPFSHLSNDSNNSACCQPRAGAGVMLARCQVPHLRRHSGFCKCSVGAWELMSLALLSSPHPSHASPRLALKIVKRWHNEVIFVKHLEQCLNVC